MKLYPFTVIQTNDNMMVEGKIKQYAADNDYEYFAFNHKREDLDNVRELYLSPAKILCFIRNIDRSLVSDALLKLCEARREDFIIVATVTILAQESPLIQRSTVLKDFNNSAEDLVKITIDFLHAGGTATKADILNGLCLSEKDVSTIYPTTYLKALAEYFAERLSITNAFNIEVIAKVFSAYMLNPNTLFMRALLDDMLGELKC